VRAIVAGEECGPKRDAAVFNAGAALYVTGRAASVKEGVQMAEELLDSGAVKLVLEQLVAQSNA
jgi:anthranilate phosphoribosyltransferase